MNKKELLKELIHEFIEDGIDFEISTLEDDIFSVRFEPEYGRMDLFTFMNDSACHILNDGAFEIIEQDNRSYSFTIKVIGYIDD